MSKWLGRNIRQGAPFRWIPRRSPTTSPSLARLALWRLTAYRWFLVSLGAATLASQVQGAAVAYQTVCADPRSAVAGHDRARRGAAVHPVGAARRAPGGRARSAPPGRRRPWSPWRWPRPPCGWSARSRGRWAGRAVRATIYGVIALTGVCRSFLLPARSVLTSELVPRELLPAAVSWRSGMWQMAAVTGPALGGAAVRRFRAARRLRGRRGPVPGGRAARGRGWPPRARPCRTAPTGGHAVQPEGGFSLLAARAGDPARPSPWICSRCCSGAPWRCCRCSPTISCAWARGATACCAPRRRWARWPCRCVMVLRRHFAAPGAPC